MLNNRNRNSVLRQLAALQKMSLKGLQEKWRDLYGSEPPQLKSTFLKKRLAYRIQELFYGGISRTSMNTIAEVILDDPRANLKRTKHKVEKNGKILSGTRFIREWGGERHEVIAREKGFEYKGKMFRSLSAIATEITGTHWNGKLFFGLKKRSA
jgi:hypothetical protein